MREYLEEFGASTLPVPIWVAFACWLISFAFQQLLLVKMESASQGTGQLASDKRKLWARQVIFGCIVFFWASQFGNASISFFAGGWLITSFFSLVLVCRAWMRKEGQASRPSQIQIMFYAAAAFLGIAFAFKHTAPLGAAMFIGASAIGYWRKARLSP